MTGGRICGATGHLWQLHRGGPWLRATDDLCHLSQIAVHEGDLVKRGQVMGTSGQTGMAGGDHIHFAMQLDGVQIDPKEWWDSHWIKDHIAKRVDLPGFK